MMPVQGALTIEQMCQLTGVSRAGFYRNLAAVAPCEEEMAVRGAIQEIVLEHRHRYGYRRVAAELRARGMVVNHKRVARLMREDNLLAIRKRRFVCSTNSTHRFTVYLNLAARMELTGPDQLWVADITYIRLQAEFLYFAALIDAFSRRVVGWALEPTLQTRLTLTALQRAIAARQPGAGLVHHSDRGSQYAADEYVQVLFDHRMIPSMSRPANPWDNAICESFMKTLKQEEIHARCYRDAQDLQKHISDFIDNYYNPVRLHSALGYRSPAACEQEFHANARPVTKAAPALSFLRHEEIYQPDAQY